MKSRRLLLALLAPALAAASPEIVLDDPFDDGNPAGNPAAPGLWKLQAMTGDNGVFENGGALTLFATTQAYTFAGLNTALDQRLNFFARPLTIAVEDMALEGKGIPDNEAVFRVSLNSTELRQNMSPQSLSVRFVPGGVFLGFKTGPIDKLAAEDVTGVQRGSVCVIRHDGRATGFTLSLDPRVAPGSVAYTLTVRTTGAQPAITRTGLMPLKAADWNADGRSALVLEARRNHAAVTPDTYMSATLGRLKVTSP